MKFTRVILDFIVNLVLWILIVTLGAPIIFLLFLWRISVVASAKLLRSDLYPTVPNDTNFAIDSSENMPIVNAAQVWRIQGLINIEEFREHFYKCFLETEDCQSRYRNLYCYLVRYGGFVFKRSVPTIELEKHIHQVQLNSETSLENFIADFMFVKKFRENAPLWEIVLLSLPLTCNTEEHETVMVFKISHVMADGYTFVHFVDILTGNTSPYLVKQLTDSFMEKAWVAFQTPKRLFDYSQDVRNTKDLFSPLKSSEPKWHISFATMDLESVKKIRRKTKTHFVTIMMSLTIGALRRLIMENHAENDIPSHIWTANSLPWPNHPRNTMTNHWSGGIFKIPFQTKNALERLNGAEDFFKFFHDSMEMHKSVKRMFIPLTWCFPSFLLRLCHSCDLSYFKYSNAFASLMLSDKKHYLLGKQVRNIYLPLALKDIVPSSVMFGVSSSHSNQLDISIAANSEVVENQDSINRMTQVYFQQELDELIHLCNSEIENSVAIDNVELSTEIVRSDCKHIV